MRAKSCVTRKIKENSPVSDESIYLTFGDDKNINYAENLC